MGKILILIIIIMFLFMLNLPSNRPPIPAGQTNNVQSPIQSALPTRSADSENFNYPNSKLISMDARGSVLESADNVNVITDWYKAQIKKSGMKTTSFIETNTNGDILNRMIGNNNQSQVSVEINKRSDQPEVRIIVYVNQ